MQSCPSCHQILLDDTPQCPACGLVLDKTVSKPSGEKTPSHWAGSGEEEKPCPSCHEMVRTGLVRCWNCGTFMQEEIGESYKQRMAKPRPIIYSVTPEDMIAAQKESIVEHSRSSTRRRSLVPEDEVSVGTGGEDDMGFEISQDVQINTESARPAVRKKDKSEKKSSSSVTVHNPASSLEKETYSISGSPAAPAATDVPAETAKSPPPAVDPAVTAVAAATEMAHSEATAGDVLLNVALQEQVETQQRQESGKRRRKRNPNPEGVIVFCPNGHRIEVSERHRGMSGRCPKCKSLFYVPDQVWEQKPDTIETAGASPAVPLTQDLHALDAGSYTRSLPDIDLLVVDPQKLKLKPGSLLGAETQHDIYFSKDNVLLVNLSKKGGLFGGGDKKKPAARETLVAQLKEGKPAAELTVAAQISIPVATFREIHMVQPVQFERDSMFAGVPVFGDGRIAILLPKVEGMASPHYLSFTLTQYRDFARIVRDLYGIDDLGEGVGIPLRNEFDELKCHYTDQAMHAIKRIDFYRADKNFKLQLIGRKCQGCGLIVSEDGRKKEKIGGKTGSGIAKFRCPKCMKPFGDISLFTLVEAKTDKPPESESAAEENEADATADTTAASATSASMPTDAAVQGDAAAKS
ncbi:MAG: hypothetical protein ACKVT0_05130 [Planctomycetaceae bacterium]